MLKITLISLLLFSKIAFSQVTDRFDDADFTQNPVWQGDISRFLVNPQKQLQSNGPQQTSQILALSTVNSKSLNASWEFFVKLDFNPSTTNYPRIYLTSNQQDLKASLNGYFVQIGQTGSTDGFHLYKQSGNTISKIINSAAKTRTSANLVQAKIRVTRDTLGKWELFTDVTGGNNFTLEGSVTDNTFTTSNFMGVYCRYATASRYNRFIFDDFVVDDLVPDITPPVLNSVLVVDSKTLELTFSEPLNQTSALLNANYVLSNNYGNPSLVIATSLPNVYRLSFMNDFNTGNYNLVLNNIKDKKGNLILLNTQKSFFYIKPYVPKQGDVVINEIFANPSGSPSLPQKEFVEIWNTTNEYLLTQGWKYSDQTSTYTFTTDTIKPNEYIILCAKADTNLFKPYGKTIGLSPWPSLNNDRDNLTLFNSTNVVIDKVAYLDTWYNDDLKKKGGFSLELIDSKNICKNRQNWSATKDSSGGTPGKQNSIYQSQFSTEIPKILSAVVLDSVTVKIIFSKAVDSLSASVVSNYTVNNGIGNPQKVVVHAPKFTSTDLIFLKPLPEGVQNTLIIKNISDCAGNLIDPAANTAELFIAKKPDKNDFLISEVLFNPKAGGVDFVEIYNNTNSVLDLKDLQLANNDVNGNLANIKFVSTSNLYVQPKSYWVLSTNTENIKTNYIALNPGNFVQLSNFPAYNNDKGNVVLLSNNKVIDKLNYISKLHHPLIQNEDGISIERVSFSVDANESDNFKSAAATVGYATPTYKNSQEYIGKENYVKLLTKTFSPDNDGFEDVLQLDYELAENSSLANVSVFTDKGVLIRKLLKNQTVATKGSLIWDGFTDKGQLPAIGIYVIVFDIFDLNGNTKRFKKTCVLAGKLN